MTVIVRKERAKTMLMGQIRKLRQLVSVEQEYAVRNAAMTLLPVRHRSRNDAVFHTCVWKTASQWVRVVLSDPRIYQYSGLKVHVPPTSAAWWPNPEALAIPSRRIVPRLYCRFDQFARVSKPQAYAVFFVQRDPRDILVSWYFSNRYSHRPNPGVMQQRQALEGLSDRDGILATIDSFEEIAAMLASWAEAAARDESIRLVRYEDLTGPEKLAAWSRLLEACDIAIPEATLADVLETYAFAKISGGRAPGEEAKSEKYRKGTAGDWQNHFDAAISARFDTRYGDLTRVLGYA